MPGDARVDSYISAAPSFAQPILEYLRELIHQSCPQVEEDIKWRQPAFLYRGKMLLSLAAFKAHCNVAFWVGPVNRMIATEQGKFAGSLRGVTELADLPSKPRLLGYLREACKWIDERASNPASSKRNNAPKPEARMPADFAAALKKSKPAAKTFQGFSPSHRREYVEWITGAKREETRRKRIASAIEMLAEGKPRNWKYM
jgi:uncharacterized protein YdeI (YjbR/CyaY-like superfamily)